MDWWFKNCAHFCQLKRLRNIKEFQWFFKPFCAAFKWFGIWIGDTPKNPNPCHFRESFPEPNHQAPNHQCTINWWLPSGKLTWQLKSLIFNRRYIFKRSTFCCHVRLRKAQSLERTWHPWKISGLEDECRVGCFSSVQFDIWQIWSRIYKGKYGEKTWKTFFPPNIIVPRFLVNPIFDNGKTWEVCGT